MHRCKSHVQIKYSCGKSDELNNISDNVDNVPGTHAVFPKTDGVRDSDCNFTAIIGMKHSLCISLASGSVVFGPDLGPYIALGSKTE